MQENERVTPQEVFWSNPIDELWESIAATVRQEDTPAAPIQMTDTPPHLQQPITPQPVEPPTVDVPDKPVEQPTVDVPDPTLEAPNNPVETPTVEVPDKQPPKTTAPLNEMEFDQALEELEKELWISTKEEEEPGNTPPEDLEAKKSLDRDQKFLKIIKELDSVNRNSLKKVSELEVELDKAQTQAELYKKQAHDYYEELRANEFDRSKFQVDDKAKNFVHYFNEFAKDSDNVHAKNWALREAIKIVSQITWRDLNNYLVDYFSMWAADLSEINWWTSSQFPNFNVWPNRAKDVDAQKIDALNNALESL